MGPGLRRDDELSLGSRTCTDSPPNCTRRFCRAALQRKNFLRRPWDFHANALTPPGAPGRPFRSGRRASEETHGCHRRQSSPGQSQLADAAGDHHLRMRDRAVEFRAAIEPRFLHPADEQGVYLGPRRLRPGAGAAEPVVGTGPADRRRDRRPFRHPARDGRRRAALCRRAAGDALRVDAGARSISAPAS